MVPPAELDAAARVAAGTPPGPGGADRLARELGPDLARAALLQADLRRRARAKFALADRMLFVPEALEQATHEGIAAYHAFLFPGGAPVADVTAGIGADLIALARRGPARGFELDPGRAAFARWNLAAHGLDAEVTVGDGVAGGAGAAFVLADPARRVAGRRTLDPAEFAPDPRAVAALGRERTVVKLSPGLPDAFLAALAPRVEFVSFGGECREAILVSDGAPGVFATLLTETGPLRAERSEPPTGSEDALWWHDPDPALVRAGALGAVGLGSVGGYLVGEEPVSSPWLRPYRRLWTGRPEPRDVAAALRSLEARAFETKSRAGPPPFDHRAVRPAGPRPVSLLFWREGKRVRAALVEAGTHPSW